MVVEDDIVERRRSMDVDTARALELRSLLPSLASQAPAQPTTKSQNDRVLRMLIDRWGGITPLDAMSDLGVMRLAARIADLRAEGHDIRSEMVKVRNRDGIEVRVARYRLVAA